MNSIKRIAWQQGVFATFAEIDIELKNANNEDAITNPMGLDVVDSHWRSGVLFALALLREKLPRVSASWYTQVTISKFHGQPCDTTMMAVAYVTFHAVAQKQAPELLKEFIFDEENAQYVISSPAMS